MRPACSRRSGLPSGTYYLRTSGRAVRQRDIQQHHHRLRDLALCHDGHAGQRHCRGDDERDRLRADPRAARFRARSRTKCPARRSRRSGVYAYTAAGSVSDSGADRRERRVHHPGPDNGHVLPAHVRTASGYADELYADGPCPFFSCGVGAGLGVGVVIDATTSGINIQLGVGGTITGTVTDATTGAPLAGKNVRIYLSSNTSYYQQVTTNASGVYTLGGLAEGTYYVAHQHPDRPGLPRRALCRDDLCADVRGHHRHAGVRDERCDDCEHRPPSRAGRRGVGDRDRRRNRRRSGECPRDRSQQRGRIGADGQHERVGPVPVGPVPPGTYYVRTVTTQNYVNELYADVACPSCGTTTSSSITVPGGASTVLVSGGATTPAIDFGLTVGGTITGTVTDAVSSAAVGRCDGVRSTRAPARPLARPRPTRPVSIRRPGWRPGRTTSGSRRWTCTTARSTTTCPCGPR